MELLYARSAIVTAAKAYGLDAIDLVCVTYQDTKELDLESREGRRLGFDGKVSRLLSSLEALTDLIMMPVNSSLCTRFKLR